MSRTLGNRSAAAALVAAATVASFTTVSPASAAAAGHAVFVQTNDARGNTVIAYRRGADGRLTEAGRYATGGVGGAEQGAVVDPLASQGSLTYDAAHRLLLAVNAGSDSFTVFAVHGSRLTRLQVLPSEGHLPVSVSVARDVVYVLDAGGQGAITGYRIWGGRLHHVARSTRSLHLGNARTPFFLSAPAQVAVTPDGGDVVVSTKNHNTLVVFPLDRDLRPKWRVVTTTRAAVPFALTFDGAGRLLVAAASGSVSSYTVHRNGTLSDVSAPVPNGQQATCWSVMARGFLYAANAGSSTITGYREGGKGALHLLDASGVTARTDAGPVDVAASSDGRYLYQQATGAGVLDEFRVHADGSLTRIGVVRGFGVDNGSGAEGVAAT